MEMIEDSVPPEERDTYQIHIPRPASESAALCTVLVRAIAGPGASVSAVDEQQPDEQGQPAPGCSVIRRATKATVP